MQTLPRHAEADVAHGADLTALLDGPAIRPDDIPWITRSATVTLDQLGKIAVTLIAR
jgi:hypothetical protein